MDKIPAAVLVIGAGIAWLGLAVVLILRLRRRRRGSSLVRSAGPSGATVSYRRIRPVGVRIGHMPERHRGLKARKVPGPE
ncbi:hypothetical protein [Pseudarthrobacter sp. NS4]|uniref:hypothetical protein n=1 Tax=Pseudarthrobacter sp. NS4 TaxID=2973976 RepID=UPI00216392CD|nr:hypothetical protein [Pseudarthrobacter sp. NS4]